MNESEILNRMGELVEQIAESGQRAALCHPDNTPAIVEICMSAATGLDIARRLLTADGDTATAVLMMGAAHRVLEVLAANFKGTNHESA